MIPDDPEQMAAFMRGETDDPGVVHAVRGGIRYPGMAVKDPPPPPAVAVGLEPIRIRWHWHRWGRWDRPYQTAGLSALWSGLGEPRQRRECGWCGLVEDRSCVIPQPMRIRAAVARWWARCRDAVRRPRS